MTLKLRARKTVKITNGSNFTYMLNMGRVYEFDPVDPQSGKPSRLAQIMIEKLINLGYMELIAQKSEGEIRHTLPLSSQDVINMSHHKVVFIEK